MSAGGGDKKTLFQHIRALPSHDTAAALTKWLNGYRFDPNVAATLGFFALLGVALSTDPTAVAAVVTVLAIFSPIWLPIMFAVGFWISWVDYIWFLFFFQERKGYKLLEVILPAEIEKSPLAMELIFNGIWNSGRETTFIERSWKGRFRRVWSFEIASNEGKIGFYIRVPGGWRNFIESRIYGQYPEAKVIEVPDYTDQVPNDLDTYDLWAGEYAKQKKPQAAPIRTYTDYELDKSADVPETKIDPLTNILELMNNMGKDEHLWVQFIVRAYAPPEQWYTIPLRGKDPYEDEAKVYVEKMLGSAALRAKKIGAEQLKADEVQQAQIAGRGMTMLTESEREVIKAIEFNTGGPMFEAGVRCIYIAKKDKYKGLTGAPLFRLFEAHRSGIQDLRGTRAMVGFDYPWEDFMGIRKRMVKEKQLFYYKERAYFNVPYDQAPVYFSMKEMASLWHFPSTNVKTPGLNKVEARRAEAPRNLPTGPGEK